MSSGKTKGTMKRHIFTALALAFGCCPTAVAGTVYDNTTTDTFGTLFFSVGSYQQIGDLVLLDGTDRSLTGASVQFYNGGDAAGTFSAILRLWNPDTLMQIGDDYQLDQLEIGASSVGTYSFFLPNLLVPDSLIATLAVLHFSDGMDLGLDLFDPPAFGRSDNTSLIVGNESLQTSATAEGSGNLYLRFDAVTVDSAVPEPSTAAMVSGILIMTALVRLLKRRLSALPPLS